MHDYCPRMQMLDFTTSVGSGKIRFFSRDGVESIHGAEKVKSVYTAAEQHLKRLRNYFEIYPGEILNQSKSSESIEFKTK